MLENMPADIPINGKYTEDPSQKEDMNVIPSNIFGRVRMYVKAAIRGKQGRKPVSIPSITVDLPLTKWQHIFGPRSVRTPKDIAKPYIIKMMPKITIIGPAVRVFHITIPM